MCASRSSLGACFTPKQLSRKHGETCYRYGFSGVQFQYETSHWYLVWLCNSYQPRCCCGNRAFLLVGFGTFEIVESACCSELHSLAELILVTSDRPTPIP